MKKLNIVFLLIASLNLYAQDETGCSSFFDRTEFKVGYYGTLLVDNGINFGFEYLLREKEKVKEKKNYQKVITHQFLLNGSIGNSTNFTSQTDKGLYTHYGLIWRKTNQKGFQFNIEVNPLGFYRSFLPETFEVKGDEVSEVKSPGRNYYTPSFAIGIGKLRKNKRLSAWYLNFNLAFRTPYNASALPVVSFQYGYRFNFKNKKHEK